MTTSALAIPLAHLVIAVANNEDWVDSLVYVYDSTADPPPQMDIRGLAFQMYIRRTPPDNEVILSASTEAGSLVTAAPPNSGYLIIYIPRDTMREVWPGAYVGDVRVSDGTYERVCLTIDLTIIEGITR
jgi:hypothetical protein